MKKENKERKRRSLELLANFDENGLASGWMFAIKESFKIALDIRLTERVKDKKTYWVWTQGTNFKFKQGYTLYNSPEGWPHPNVTAWVQVTEAMDTTHATQHTEGSSGLVIFDLYFRHIDGSAIKDDRPKICNQAEFVTFLKTGILHGVKIVG